MLRRPTRRRPAFSLVEVLVALFIVAAGLIALLTLFPLGAVQMAQAMRDDRSQLCALQGDEKLRRDWQETVFETIPLTFNVTTYANPVAALNGTGGQPAVTGLAVPSYPVLVDPIGVRSFTPPRRDWVAGVPYNAGTTSDGVARSSPNRFLGNVTTLWTLQDATRYCTLMDDMEFAPDGTPADRDGTAVSASGQNIFRQGRYSWAALLQKPDNSNPSVVNLKVLVFDRRPVGVDSVDAELSFTPANPVTVGDTTIDLPAAIDTVPLRAGGWLFDGTVIDPVPANQFANPNAGTGIRNGNFYRVKSVADIGGTVTRVELQTPIVRPTGSPSTATYNARFYVFAYLIDVYDRPALTPSGYQKQTP